MSAVNVDQVLVDLATSLEATASTRYTDALNFMVPGSLAPTADTMKTYIFGSTSMAVNFASLIVTTIVLVKRLADLAADTSGSVQTTRMISGYSIAATAFSGSRWLSGNQEVRFRGDKFTTRESSDDLKSAFRSHKVDKLRPL